MNTTRTIPPKNKFTSTRTLFSKRTNLSYWIHNNPVIPPFKAQLIACLKLSFRKPFKTKVEWINRILNKSLNKRIPNITTNSPKIIATSSKSLPFRTKINKTWAENKIRNLLRTQTTSNNSNILSLRNKKTFCKRIRINLIMAWTVTRKKAKNPSSIKTISIVPTLQKCISPKTSLLNSKMLILSSKRRRSLRRNILTSQSRTSAVRKGLPWSKNALRRISSFLTKTLNFNELKLVLLKSLSHSCKPKNSSPLKTISLPCN